ncbi:MAG: SLC13 family permease [Spirochaetales bacterium]|nr:MAG: SLC13 family permease [Spirochaetales bacterium]
MITWQMILVFTLLVFILISLYRELFGPVLTFIMAVVVLGLTGILKPSEILSGFGNEQLVVIILLLLLGDIIRKTRVIQRVFDRIFSASLDYKGFLGRMMGLVAVFSAFMNNTPLVAVMMPYVHSWSRKNSISPSRLLIPLSYAAILGGCATLIGTSTNLIVNSMVVEQGILPNGRGLEMFSFLPAGGAMLIIGTLFMVTLGYRLLPSKKDILEQFAVNEREYILEAQVVAGSSLIATTVEAAGFSGSKGVYLAEIVREDVSITPVQPDTALEAGDVLLFTGDFSAVTTMIEQHADLSFPAARRYSRRTHLEVAEIVVSHNSLLIGKTARETEFTSKFDASIVAIHRNGERVSGKLGETRFRAGDVLLLYAGPDLAQRGADTQDFYFISRAKDINRFEPWKITVMLIGTAAAITLSALKLVPLVLSLLVLIIVLSFLKVAAPKDIVRGIDYKLYILIALSLALGKAMVNTGAAELIASGFISLFRPLGLPGILFGVYLITAVLAAYITNKAAVAVIFPIAMTTALELGVNPVPFVLAVSFAAAANFMTPIGYQTNLMVYGPGGYSFKDFMRVGTPLTVIYMAVTVTVLSLMYFR